MQQTYRYTPQYRPFIGATVSFLLLVLSSVLSFLSLHLQYKFLLNCGALTVLLISFFTFFRYCLVRYEYILQDNILRVIRKTGANEDVIFDLTLSLCFGITPEKKKRKIKEIFSAESINFFYRTQSLLAKKTYCLVYSTGGVKGVFLEIDESFADAISALIKPF